MNIEKLKSGNYRISEMVNGIRYRKTISFKPKVSEARQIIYEMVENEETSVNRWTIRQTLHHYIDLSRPVRSPGSIKHYLGYMNVYPEWFLNAPLRSLNDEKLQRFVNELTLRKKKNGQAYSSKYISNLYSLVRASVTYYRPKYVPRVALQPIQKKPVNIPLDEDIKRLSEAITGTKYEIGIKLAIFGLRRAEICALTADDVKDDTIFVHADKIYTENNEWVIREYAKNDTSARIVHIPIELADAIKEKGVAYEGSPDSLGEALRRILKKLGIQHFSIHKLRHYYASTFMTIGVPQTYLMHEGGWKTDNVLKTVYQHAQKDKIEAVIYPALSHLNDLL